MISEKWRKEGATVAKNDDSAWGIGFIALMIIFPPFGIFVLCATVVGIIAAILWPKVDKSLKNHYANKSNENSEGPQKIHHDINKIIKAFTGPVKDNNGMKKANWVFIRGTGTKQTYDVKCPDCLDFVNIVDYRESWHCSNMHEFSLDFDPHFGKVSSTITPNIPYNFLISVEIMFEIMGFLAKCDGKVTEEEIECSVEIMTIFLEGLDNEDVRKKLENSFRKGKEHSNYKEKVKAFNFLNAHDILIKESFIKGLIALAYVDGSLDATEKKIIEEICFIMNIYSPEELNSYFEKFAGYYQKSQESMHGSFEATLLHSFAVLGCSPSDDASTIKKRYFELCKKYHPDSYELRHADELSKKEAEKKIKEVNNAWEAISGYLKTKNQRAA
jgi:DnaJ like chaperone protein